MPPSNTRAIILRALANTGSPRFPSLPSTHDNKKGWPLSETSPSIKPHAALFRLSLLGAAREVQRITLITYTETVSGALRMQPSQLQARTCFLPRIS